MEHNYDDQYELDNDDFHQPYRPPLSQHYHHPYAHEMREPHFYRLQPEVERNWLTCLLSYFDSKGAFFAFAVAFAVVLYTHYQGMFWRGILIHEMAVK